MFLRLFGVGLILLSVAVYPLIGAIAISSSLNVTEKAIYSSLVYALSWIILIIGAYFAGPELVKKIKTISANLKNRIFAKISKKE
jgi:acid stress-induced BolA-like protein IbaG/YrbA